MKRKTKREFVDYQRLEPRMLLSGTAFTKADGTGPAFPAINLAKFQRTIADSSGDNTSPEEATDGIVSNDSRWYSDSSGPHWLEVQLTTAFPIGSAQLFLGKDDSFTVSNFEIQFHDGANWQTIVEVENNSATDLNLVFPYAVYGANRFRFYTTDSIARVKEFVLLPPSGDQGYPLGTDVDLNLASRRSPLVSSIFQSNRPTQAVDGWVDDNSRWLANGTTGPHTIELEIPTIHEVGSLHFYSGYFNGVTDTSPLSSFQIHYANGNGWTPIPGGTVSSGSLTGNLVFGNSSTELVVDFSQPVSANKIRLTFSQAYGRIREIVVLPENVRNDGQQGYEIGTSVQFEPDPRTNFKDFHDSWYRIAARSNGNSLISDRNGSSQADANTSDEAKRFQLLYSYSLDAYRLRNQDSGKVIEVQDASTSPGAAIVEGFYSAAPHQLWRLQPTSDGYYQFENVWSGLVISTDGATPAVVTQEKTDSGNSIAQREWRPVFQDDYFKKGTGGWVGQYNTGWAYDWARNDPNPANEEFFYVPMQHREGWPNLTTLHRRFSDWNNDHRPAYLLGFNEPDRPDQADMTVQRAIELWPHLMAMDIPLVSPATSLGGENWWLNNFFDQADELGYRVEYSGTHWYSGPSATNLLNHIDHVQNQSNGRPVWLTEFAVVDWTGGSGDWSEESNYNFILEFLWRAESKANLEKYAVFLFSGNSPNNPWDLTNPRSNFFSGGSLTPFGKAYSAWDGDKNIQVDEPYLIHNRNARHRLRNSGSDEPTPSWIRREDASVQWVLRDAGNGNVRIESAQDGRLLGYDGNELKFLSSETSGSIVEWKYQQEQYGWHNIVHPSTGEYLRLVRQNNSNNAPINQYFEMVSAADAAGYTSTDWWFVKPHDPVENGAAAAENRSAIVDRAVHSRQTVVRFTNTGASANTQPQSNDNRDEYPRGLDEPLSHGFFFGGFDEHSKVNRSISLKPTKFVSLDKFFSELPDRMPDLENA